MKKIFKKIKRKRGHIERQKYKLIFFSFIIVSLFMMTAFFLIPDEYKELVESFFLRTFIVLKAKTAWIAFKLFITTSWSALVDYFIKFFVSMTLKKFAIMTVVGLIKRYVIDHVIVKHIYLYFIQEIKEPVGMLMKHILTKYRSFSIKKKVSSFVLLFIPVGIAGYVVYAFNLTAFILEKVFSANMWKAILAFLMKIAGPVFYFFTDYLWNSWVTPLIEILLLTWLIGFLEKHVSFIGKPLRKVYKSMSGIIDKLSELMYHFFHRPIKRTLQKGAVGVTNKIHKYVGHIPPSKYALQHKQQQKDLSEHIKVKNASLYEKLNKRIQKKKEKEASKKKDKK